MPIQFTPARPAFFSDVPPGGLESTVNVMSPPSKPDAQASGSVHTSPTRKRVTHTVITMSQSNLKTNTGKTESNPDSDCQIESQSRAFAESLACASGLY